MASFDMTLPRAWARVAGVCWVISIAGGMFAEVYVRAKLIAHDPATTIQNILANEQTYRLGSAAEFVGTAVYLALTVILYRLLAPINRTVSLIAAFFSAAGCTMWMMNLAFDAAPLVFIAGTQAASGVPDQTQSLTFALLKLHPEALILGMICFGVQCLLLGYLIVRSTFLPKVLGALLAVGGVGYLVAGFTHILSPTIAMQIGRYTFLPGEAAEVIMALWLTVIGVSAAKWKEAAGSMAGVKLGGANS
jgi:hypothetical protein